MTYYRSLSHWLDVVVLAAKDEHLSDEGDFDVTKLTDDDLGVLRVGIDGIHDSCRDMYQMLKELPDSAPSQDYLETVLINLESHLDHCMYHWRDLVSCLRAREQWPDDDEDDARADD